MNQTHTKPGRLVLAAQPHLDIPALYVHDLTGTSEAERLLSTPARVHPRSSLVLPNLRKYNPELAAKLLEKDDAVKHMPFKLITTSPHWTPKIIDCFVSLSYCWHGEDWEIPSRYGGTDTDWDFPICPVTLKAVLLRHTSRSRTSDNLFDFAMWVDQICIDQSDALERFHAVANMDVIYRNASEVEILLEDIDFTEEEEKVFALLHGMEKGVDPDPYIYVRESCVEENLQKCYDAGLGGTFFKALTKTFDSRWFTRAWCRHEYMLNVNPRFILAGRRSTCIVLDPRIFIEIAFQFEEYYNEGSLSSEHDELLMHPSYQDFGHGVNDRVVDYTTDGCLFEMFGQLHRLNCTFQRDIISIALNATGIRLSINSEIKSRKEGRYMLSMIALSAGDASVLAASGLPIERLNYPGHQSLIYWTRDYQDDWSYLSARLSVMGNDTKIYHIDPEKVSLNAFVFKSLPSSPPFRYRENAEQLSSLLQLETSTQIDVLDCVLNLGPKWLCRASVHHDDIVEDDTDFKRSGPTINDFKIYGERTLKEKFGKHSSTVAMFLSNFAHCDHWFSKLDDTTAMTISLGSITGGKKDAVILVPSDVVDGVSRGEYTIAVPIALKNPTALALRRIWILEPARTDPTALALVGRGYLIEAEPLKSWKMSKVQYVKKLTIFGKWEDSPCAEEDALFEDSDEDESDIEDRMSHIHIDPVKPSASRKPRTKLGRLLRGGC